MTYLRCSNHRDQQASYLAVYKREDEESRAVYCDACAEKKRALNNPRLTLTRLGAGKLSQTGKPLCARCRKLASHEGNYYRVNGHEPAVLFYCDMHAQLVPDALPLAVLAIAIPALLEVLEGDISAEDLCMELQRAGIGNCTRDMAQDALWLRYPEKYCWSKQGYYVSRAKALRENPRVGAAMQKRLDSLLLEREVNNG